MDAETVVRLAHECGFELAGIAPAAPLDEYEYYRVWVEAGMAGQMRYLTDHRAALRADPRCLLPEARSVICVGMLYNTPMPASTAMSDPSRGWISRYAWGEDYHALVRAALRRLLVRLREHTRSGFAARIAVDAAPLLERALARRAGLGWIGRNTCLINQWHGSWFFLGELLVSLEIDPGSPPAELCGSCMRCVEACPTGALVPTGLRRGPAWALDARRCTSYLTFELRGPIPEPLRPALGGHVFGCDICQEVCPWNRKAPVTAEQAFQPRHYAPALAELASLDAADFAERFARSPVRRAGHAGLLRNVAVALGNSGLPAHRAALERLAVAGDPMVAEHAHWGLARLSAAGGYNERGWE
ncbi:MAG: tRNA epoxyqueuosine(34) reductase QueG [Bryobacteraceae bacterium]